MKGKSCNLLPGLTLYNCMHVRDKIPIWRIETSGWIFELGFHKGLFMKKKRINEGLPEFEWYRWGCIVDE